MDDASHLLAALGSGVRPVDLPEHPGARPLEAWDFDALLREVRAGALRSGHQLRLVGVEDDALTEAQTKRLAETADAAEAGGMSRIAAIIDGFAVDMDVTDRTVGHVLRIAPASATSVMRAPFDGLVVVADAPPPPLKGPSGTGRGLAPGVLGVIGTID